jgi:hypothetical protein
MLTTGGAAVGLGLLAERSQAFGQGQGGITQGDAAVLRFLAAAEIIETDLWLQYAELGGTQDNQLPGLPTGGSSAYTAALANLDADMPQYIHDNTRDELSHETFINAFWSPKARSRSISISFGRYRVVARRALIKSGGSPI